MAAATILVVQANPVTRKLVRTALEKRGYSVLVAASGQEALTCAAAGPVDVVLQDLALPDMDGFELERRLRNLPDGSVTSILAFSSILSNADEERLARSAFDDVIPKPIDPLRLVAVVDAHVSAPASGSEQALAGKSLIVADDNPAQLKLTRFRLERLGFVIEGVADGAQVIAAARRTLPDAIVSDALMPTLDGFGLALAIKADPDLRHIPLLLLTSSYVEPADRDLARRAGAEDLIVRTPTLVELSDALRQLFHGPRIVSNHELPVAELDRERADRANRQLERQVVLNDSLARRCSTLAAELGVIGAISKAMLEQQDVEATLAGALAACFDFGGVALGTLYVVESEHSENGFVALPLVENPALDAADIRAFWRRPERLLELVESGETTIWKCGFVDDWLEEILRTCGATAALVVPLNGRHAPRGALFVAVSSNDSDEGDWQVYVEAITNQIAQALALVRAFREREVAEQVAREQSRLLRDSEERFRATFEHAPVGVVQLSPDGCFLDVNENFSEIVGYTRAELVGRSVKDITCAEDYPRNFEHMRKMLAGELAKYSAEKRYVRKNGALVWCALNVILVRNASDCAPKYFVAVVQDISARKNAEEELECTAAQLRQAQKMEAIGRLAGGIAHDFNNMLSVIHSYGSIILSELSPSEAIRADVENIVLAGERAANLTRQLLLFSRQQVLSPRFVDVSETVQGLIDMLGRIIGEDLELRFEPTACGRVYVDPGQLQQVVMNLVVNARDAMPDGGSIHIETHEEQLGASRLAGDPGIEPGTFVALVVRDTGTGMDAETQSRIFEPFFTTKGPGKGTGLGLSTVFGIVRQSGGVIRVFSEPSAGSTFTVYLPRACAAVARSEPPAPSAEMLRGTETVLLVEDDEQVRNLAARILDTYGYRVLLPDTPEDATRLSGDFDAPIHLLLTDVVMPRIGGKQLAERLSQQHPEMKVLFMSGYNDGAVVHHDGRGSESALLQKPFMPQTLLSKLREVLAPSTVATTTKHN